MLAGLFLSYRAGAFNSRSPDLPPAEVSAANPAASAAPTAASVDPKIMMSGSKSLAPISFIPAQPAAPPPGAGPDVRPGAPAKP
jgi:hypothetical protein